MALAQSKVTAQGQISVPAEVRRRLGIGPGAVLEWDEENGQIVVRKAGRYSSQEVHEAVFGAEPPTPPRTLEEMDQGIRQHLKARAGRRDS
jgi:antitoxin PrlF